MPRERNGHHEREGRSVGSVEGGGNTKVMITIHPASLKQVKTCRTLRIAATRSLIGNQSLTASVSGVFENYVRLK